ncbi:hypothetical protein GGTG_06451 [Gaeumannomyces tritici R3-111a-1]|uniref:Uncharacterized protein n=1 Tax=Gaeumannomyces tritici (strain R3-111a-1) TaxID=644352 RepID=J3NYU9_GAET3|nr:hypothetical protein GGTG_06451 [Gaeumannomyces tritici R3-111a-1]EJT76532.1 hypothetical protein GGTG_06451 [Gaeumannomyces tritici R3-111a-1]
MTGSSSNQAGSAVSSSSSSAAASASGMMQYYYDTDASYGFMQQEPAWLMATPIDDDDLTFGGKSLSTWYEEDRRRFSLGDESSRTMESDEEEESRGRQRVRAHYDAPSSHPSLATRLRGVPDVATAAVPPQPMEPSPPWVRITTGEPRPRANRNPRRWLTAGCLKGSDYGAHDDAYFPTRLSELLAALQ